MQWLLIMTVCVSVVYVPQSNKQVVAYTHLWNVRTTIVFWDVGHPFVLMSAGRLHSFASRLVRLFNAGSHGWTTRPDHNYYICVICYLNGHFVHAKYYVIIIISLCIIYSYWCRACVMLTSCRYIVLSFSLMRTVSIHLIIWMFLNSFGTIFIVRHMLLETLVLVRSPV